MAGWGDENLNRDAVDVEIAGAGSRIVAAMLNGLFNCLVSVPTVVAMFQAAAGTAAELGLDNKELAVLLNSGNEEELGKFFEVFFTQLSGNSWLWIGLAVAAFYLVWQTVWMGRYGQSVGKRIVGIRVIKTNGSDAGFLGVVVMREMVYGFAVGIITAVVEIAVGTDISLLPPLICLIMLFAAKDRRTLQDWVADTVVVKLPNR